MQKQFEQYLKNSDYLRDVMNTNRRATADLIAGFVLFMREGDTSPDALKKWLRSQEDATGAGPSVDGERRRIAMMIGEAVKAAGGPQ